MGFSDLRIVNSTKHLDKEAKWLAHGSTDILEKASTFNSLESAIHDLDFIIGTTSKKRSVKNDYYSPESTRKIIEQKAGIVSRVGIVFGREESGLKNEELLICDLASTIPLVHSYPSINLGQSVMIYAYVFSSFSLQKRRENIPIENNDRVFQELKTNTSAILSNLHVDRNPNLYHRIMERIVTVNESDAGLLVSIAKKIRQKFE